MMKKVSVILLAMVALILSVVSCSGKTERQEPLYYYKAEFVDAGKKLNLFVPM